MGSLSAFDPDFEDLPETLPVFPLTGAVLFPGGVLPLNIFEPRYLAMVRAALATPSRMIGMIQPEEYDADRILDPDVRIALSLTGCAGRIVGFQETGDSRYFITLSGLIRFAPQRELPIDPMGYRSMVPDYAPYRSDMMEVDFRIPNRDAFLELLRSYAKTKSLGIDWPSIEGAEDRELIVSLAMLCPLPPAEKQALLECANIAAMAETLAGLFELSLAQREAQERLLH